MAKHYVILLLFCFVCNSSQQLLEDVNPDIHLDLYTSQNPDDAFVVLPNNTGYSILLAGKPLIALTHGWVEHADKQYLIDMKDELLQKGKYNVIIIGWEKLAITEYVQSAINTKIVGEYVGVIVTDYVKRGVVKTEAIHLIGHSLGAHVMGCMGKYIKKQTNTSVKRITGLDPAGPGFDKPVPVSKDKRLSKNDAQFVDVIHTSGGPLGYGYTEPLGHVDFYVNGGLVQPGCSLVPLFGSGLCSHHRSYKFFIETVTSPNSFIGSSCSDWLKCTQNKHDLPADQQVMGFDVNKAARGNYYLCTETTKPYGRGVPGSDGKCHHDIFYIAYHEIVTKLFFIYETILRFIQNAN